MLPILPLFNNSLIVVNGTVFDFETFVYVRWGWIIFLAAHVFLGTLFFIYTIVLTAINKDLVLKSSALATLVALDSAGRHITGGLAQPDQIRRRIPGRGARGVEATISDDKLEVTRDKTSPAEVK